MSLADFGSRQSVMLQIPRYLFGISSALAAVPLNIIKSPVRDRQKQTKRSLAGQVISLYWLR